MKKTKLYEAHLSQNAKLVGFAGYMMPIHYDLGILKEHLWVREKAGIFDVSHMGQLLIKGEGSKDFFEQITPSSFQNLPIGKAKYTVLTNNNGGIIDDLIISSIDEHCFFLVVNASRKQKDTQWIKQHLPVHLSLTDLNDRSLIALQGPQAEKTLKQVIPEIDFTSFGYMSVQQLTYQDNEIFVSRLGYTGEDGFEISIGNTLAEDFWKQVCTNENVQPIGLGARDTLRLEMGYPLYGNDLDETLTPVEANLSWIIDKNNTQFIGAPNIISQHKNGPPSKRIGFKLLENGIAREETIITNNDGTTIGKVTSGGFSPSLKQAIGQGYINSKFNHEVGEEITLIVRNKKLKAQICPLSFLKANTKK